MSDQPWSGGGFDMAAHKRLLHAAKWVVVHGEGDDWIAFDEPSKDLRRVTIAHSNGLGCFGVDIRLSACGPDVAEQCYGPAIAAIATQKGEEFRAVADEAFRAFA